MLRNKRFVTLGGIGLLLVMLIVLILFYTEPPKHHSGERPKYKMGVEARFIPVARPHLRCKVCPVCGGCLPDRGKSSASDPDGVYEDTWGNPFRWTYYRCRTTGVEFCDYGPDTDTIVWGYWATRDIRETKPDEINK